MIADTNVTLIGGGSVSTTNFQTNRLYAANGGFRITNESGNTIHGGLALGAGQAALTNRELIHADASAGMTIDPTDSQDFTNEGTLWLETGNVTINSGPFINSGVVLIDAGRTLTRSGNIQQTNGGTTNNGVLNLTSGSFLLQGGQLSGDGSVNGGLVNNSGGTVAPGNSAGALVTGAGYTQGSGGALDIEVGGLTPVSQHDQLQVTGNAALAGTLHVERINGYVPNPNDEFTILTATGTRTGTFAAVDSCDVVTVIYGSNFVQITINPVSGPGADFNNDGQVNASDLAVLLGAWGPCGDCCFADINGDEVVDASDLALLLGSWN